MSSEKKPNILIFMPDEMRADSLACMGNPIIKTPNLDKVGKEGVVFTNCFAVNPVCAPSRCSTFTGLYPHCSGHRSLYYFLQPHEENLLKFLKNSGYYVRMIGRNDLFSKKAFKTNISKRTGGFSKVDLKAYLDSPPVEDRFRKSFYSGKRGEKPVKDLDYSIIQEALEFLDSNPPEPFCLFLALSYPHPPYSVEEPYFSMYDRQKIPAPIPPTLDDKPHFMKEMYESYNLNLLSEEDKKEIIATYYGMVSRVDDQFGTIIEKFKEKNYYNHTAVFFFGDHGDYTTDYGLTEKWPTGFQDCLIKVPLIIKIPGIKPNNNPINNLVETIDLFPTMLEIANIKPKYTHFGKSLIPLIKGEDNEHRDLVFAEGGYLPREPQCFEVKIKSPDLPLLGIYYDKIRISYDDPSTVSRSAMIRTKEWKYVARIEGKEELYNLKSDSQELINLIDDHNLKETKAKLKERLLKWYISTSDNAPMKKERAL